MMNRAETVCMVGLRIALGGVILAGPAFGLSACGKKEEQRPTTQQTYTPPPREVRPLENLSMDPRVQFPDERSPKTREAAEAIAGLASALAGGDAEAMKQYLAPTERSVLSEMMEDGAWSRATGGIEVVRICAVEEFDDRLRVGLGVQTGAEAILMAWEGLSSGGGWTFSAIPIEPRIALAARDLDDISFSPIEIPGPEYDVFLEPEQPASGSRRTTTSSSPSSPGPGPGGPSPR